MAPPLFWEAPPSPGGRSRNSGRGLSRPLCSCCRRRARARSSSRSRSPAAGLSRPGCRRQLAVSGGGPGAWGPGAREGRAQGEARAERPRERDWGESRRRRGARAARSGAGTSPQRDARGRAAALGLGFRARLAGTCGFGGPGFGLRCAPPARARSISGPTLEPGRGGGTSPAGQQRSRVPARDTSRCALK